MNLSHIVNSNEDTSKVESSIEVTERLLENLGNSMAESCKEFVFTCGGSVPINSSEVQGKDFTTPSCNPVALRWDSSDPSTPNSHCKLDFPIEPSTSDNLTNLVADMAPATFGLGGKDVFDETYRKASKLDPSQFSINFSPYECGIVDSIAQILLPSWKAQGDIRRHVKAELYKLNVYAGPSGHFHSHVDTPRSESQFGSLVVCLPVAHEGGQLEVRHKAKTITFDWSDLASSQSAIQWAAFYSDCEHEVFEVRSGYRVTLTYNLYAVRGNGQLTGHSNALDLTQVPLYKHMRAILDYDSFMPKGGYLGFHTSHSYPHTSRCVCLPDILKGIDMALWECLRALGCGVCLRPIVFYRNEEFWDKYKVYYPEHSDESDDGEEGLPTDFIGAYFPAHIDGRGEFNDLKKVFDSWSADVFNRHLGYNDVTWLNVPAHKEFQLAFTVYGNQGATTAVYSSCAIIVEVPPYEKGVGRGTFSLPGKASPDPDIGECFPPGANIDKVPKRSAFVCRAYHSLHEPWKFPGFKECGTSRGVTRVD
ncbi:hypothetical protein F4805DRAFT_109316 [Annulohypoxylon moriforme]|nr:hypothetical protein F4805DRAFT_109316 [Annulohypoxylon moriforme]